MKRFLATGIFALALAAGGASAADVFVRIGPPAPQREVIVTRPSPRHVWTPGYYAYTGNRYNWVGGSWVLPPRDHARWVQGHWAHRRGGYVWIPGHWR